jgi:hypothetical protein
MFPPSTGILERSCSYDAAIPLACCIDHTDEYVCYGNKCQRWEGHRKEGDQDNAAYWYGRSGKPVCHDSLDAEWLSIVTKLLGSDQLKESRSVR